MADVFVADGMALPEGRAFKFAGPYFSNIV
jgi:hypothetical protein